jgi:hypothetical protein
MGIHILGACRFSVIPMNPETVRLQMHRDGAPGHGVLAPAILVDPVRDVSLGNFALAAERGGMPPLLTRSLLVETVPFL